MRQAASELEFERAARLRDQLTSVRKAIERQQMVGDKDEDYDAIGLAEDDLEASIQVFNVRRGRMVGRKGLVLEKVEELSPEAQSARILEMLYGDAQAEDVPKEVLLPVEPEELELYEEFLCHVRGSKVRIRVPKRGNKRGFLETVTKNAEEAFTRHRLKRASDHNARARALTALQDALDLPEAPLRIECYDISHTMGTEIVASMVVMEDGLAKRSDYRRFKIRSLDNQDDFAAMSEVITRRFSNYLREREEGVQAGKRFSYPPNLVLIDGGKGQLSAAVTALEELGLEEIPVASLAKKFEEVYRPGEPDPIRIPRDSEALYLLQARAGRGPPLRHHLPPQRRGKAMTKSILDDIPGLGPGRRKRLLKEFGSVKKIRALTEEELVAVTWLPEAVGRRIYDRLHTPSPPDPFPRSARNRVIVETR